MAVEIDDILDVDQVRPARAAEGFTITGAAEILSRDAHISIGRDQLFTVLSDAQWILRDVRHHWIPTSRASVNGWLLVDPVVIRVGHNREVVPQVRVTLDGLRTLRQHLAPPDVPPPPTLFD